MTERKTSRDERTIVLTGATRGLGRVLAAGFAERGHRVIGCGRDKAAIADLAATFPAPHDFTALDVAEDGDVGTWAERILERHGSPDLVINNAALMNDPAPLWDVPAEQFDALLRVNLGGVANVIRHMVPAMIATRRGVIVNLSSGWGRGVSPDVAPYCTTKWGIEGLSRALACELPAGMACVALNPGIIDTDMLRQCWGDQAGAYPSATDWAAVATDFILRITTDQNGRPLTVPA